jgi:hypothetical protein
MQRSSSTPPAWLCWSCAAALAIVLTPAAFANGGGGGGGGNQCTQSETRSDETQPTSQQRSNPCNNDNFLFNGTFRTQTRDKTKGDCSVESRQLQQTNGEGTGLFATYKVREEVLDVFRFGPRRPTIFIHREDQRIIAEKETPLGKQTDQAASFFHTLRTKDEISADGTRTKSHRFERTRCKRDERGHDDDHDS